MDKTPISNRLHIGIFGVRNVGKSSFINALTNQELAIVSPVAGTTTDPVHKTIEILPEPGPCVIIDTGGLDDIGALGELRKKKALLVLDKTDLAIVLIDPLSGITQFEESLIQNIQNKNIPIVLVVNKTDLATKPTTHHKFFDSLPHFSVSSLTGEGINEIRAALNNYAPSKVEDLNLVTDFVKKGDTVVLVIPIDSAMPKGRLILPEVQTLRAILDNNACAVVCKEHELKQTLSKLKKEPDLVITDSQVYHIVKNDIPEHVRLTSFSMLFARYKGDFETLINGANAIDTLEPHSKILIAEACTHHPQPQDIGLVKIPKLLENHVKGPLKFDHYVGSDFPETLSHYSLIIMCGSCMINKKQVTSRIKQALSQNIPITNYGIVFAKMSGILDRTSWLLDYK